MIRFIVTDPNGGGILIPEDHDITGQIMECDKIHETIIDDGGEFEYPELSFVCDNSQNWVEIYEKEIKANRLYLYVFDDEVLLYAGIFRNVIPSRDYASRSVQFFTDSILQSYKLSYHTLFFSQSSHYNTLVEMSPFGGFEAFTKLGSTEYAASFYIGSFEKAFREVFLKSDYPGEHENVLKVWGDILRATACTYIWKNGHYRVQNLGGVLFEADPNVNAPVNITDSILQISRSEPWSKSRAGVAVSAGDDKYYSDYASDEDQESAHISAEALNHMWFQNGTRKDSFKDVYAPNVLAQYERYFANPAGDGLPLARIAYDVEVDGLGFYCGQGVKVDYLPGSFLVDELYRNLEDRTTELKLVSL
jgi:hypothetical protein